MPVAVGLLVLALAFWGGVLALPESPVVSPRAWSVLFVCCAVACVVTLRRREATWSAAVWLYLALCCALAGAFFFGADFGLDALHGAGRPKTDVAASLGGLELWHVLLPGLSSLCLACCAGLTAKVYLARQRS